MSFKKYRSQRQHKERSQPRHRRRRHHKLEKHRDYVERARSYHQRQATLANLTSKAFFRNDDEFYFGMKSEKAGALRKRETKMKSNEELQALKALDLGFVREMKGRETKKIHRLKESIHFVPSDDDGDHITQHVKRTVFVDELPEEHSVVAALQPCPEPPAKLVEELRQRTTRVENLAVVERELELQRALTSKGKAKRVGTDRVGFPVYKWRRERKR